MTVRHRLTALTLVFMFVLSTPPGVLAEEEPPVIKALYDTFAELGGERPSHATLTTDSDGTITVSGIKLLMQNYQQNGEDVRQELTADVMVISDVKTLSDGLFEAGKMMLKNAAVSVTTPELESFKMSMPVVQSEGAYIRAPSTLKTSLDRVFSQSFLARSTTIPLTTISAGPWSLDVHDVKFTWNGDPMTFMGESIYSIGSIELPASLFTDVGMQPSLHDLGYDRVVLGATGRADMGLAQELLEIEGETGLLAKEMGAFSIAGAAGGIQPALFEAAQAVQEAPNSIDITAMMAMMQTITISHMKLRYDDASLAERLLKHVERSDGKTREQLVVESTALSEFSMAGLNSPALSAEVREALSTFLTRPGWIQLELRPEQPVSVNKIMSLLGTPEEIVKLLNIKVTAGAAPQ